MEPSPSHQTPQRDVDARTRVFLAEEMFLRRVVRNRVADDDAIDEVLQEVAVALTKAPEVPLDAIRPWLCRVAIRQALLYRRQSGRRRSLQSNYSAAARDRQTADDGDPLLWMLAGERRQQLQTAVSRLGSEDESLLTLKYIEGCDYRRIAAILQISEHTVAHRLRAARQKLRAELERLNLKDAPESKPR